MRIFYAFLKGGGCFPLGFIGSLGIMGSLGFMGCGGAGGSDSAANRANNLQVIGMVLYYALVPFFVFLFSVIKRPFLRSNHEPATHEVREAYPPQAL